MDEYCTSFTGEIVSKTISNKVLCDIRAILKVKDLLVLTLNGFMHIFNVFFFNFVLFLGGSIILMLLVFYYIVHHTDQFKLNYHYFCLCLPVQD